jgi:hypothetical protein
MSEFRVLELSSLDLAAEIWLENPPLKREQMILVSNPSLRPDNG